MNLRLALWIWLGLGILPAVAQPAKFTCTAGQVSFVSEAPLEVIRAASGALTGVIDPVARTFAFAVDIQSFSGFNSELQRDHFREKYMEAGRFPQAAFTGRIIEDTDFSQPGSYAVRAKGMLTVHGIAAERIIRASIVSAGNTLQVSASFTVPLAEHQIAIPKLVTQKVAEEIQVSVSAGFRR